MKKLLIFCLVINTLLGAGEYIDTKLIAENCKGEDYALCIDTISSHKSENDYKYIDWVYIEKIYIDLCDIPYARACRALGNFYAPNAIDAIKTDWMKSTKYNKKACQLNEMVACHNLGVLYKLGIFYQKDYEKALELYTKACSDKDHSAVTKACNSKDAITQILQQRKEIK